MPIIIFGWKAFNVITTAFAIYGIGKAVVSKRKQRQVVKKIR